MVFVKEIREKGWKKDYWITAFQLIIPNIHKAQTINPAINTPVIIAANAYLNLILNNDAAITPLHAPVIGSGTATKSISPNASYFCMFSDFFLVRSNNQLKNRDQILNFLNLLETGSKRNNAGIIIILLPNTDNQNTLLKDMPKDNPIGIAPLNSDIGNAPRNITMYSLGKPLSQSSISVIIFVYPSFLYPYLPIKGTNIQPQIF